jgi:hypothetical protein
MTRPISFTAAAVFILVLWVLTLWVLLAADPPKYVQDWKPGEKEWVTQRMKYHGIWACIEEKGEHYFYRDGKKCKL